MVVNHIDLARVWLGFVSLVGDGRMVWAERRVAELEAELAESLTIQNKEVMQ